MEHQVFISYATDKGDSTGSKERQAADMICSRLESEGIRCWIAPRDILPGDDWLDSIIDAVEKSEVVVLVFSANANHSQWVKDEIKLALDKNIKIIPFRIDDVSPQGGLRILKVRCQWLDAYTPPLDKHIEQLVTVVCQYLGIEPKKATKGKEGIIVKKQPEPGKEKIKKPGEMPEDVEAVKSKAKKVYKNKKGFWEADYGDGIIMVYIPPGEFTMGSNDYDDEKPPHTVFLDGYWMGKYAVTFDQYDKFCGETDQEKPGDEGWGREKRPVIYVSWHDAAAYCDWLSEKIGLKFKLPTEAQWEKAARGTDSRTYPWGNSPPSGDKVNFADKQAWLKEKFDWADKNIDDGYAYTAPVGSFPKGASPYGLLDMAGNVWEWCNDWYAEDYYKNSPRKNPQGPESGTGRVIRGGSWLVDAAYIRCAYRSDYHPYGRYYVMGFRLSQDNR
ncbi:MAG: SUMF1/EgtB/PvdO family nonheme iron enzyme [Candidatus Aminicenantes bacterium]|nr:SUMF1/EgtB/PvdO family nonheme iron enzyme [Candidatus Aminicenantes bacterium]NIM83213.1 SUMF1/EgtB/PvdO family nonheme iron enzyme [Candidatus Aminicenantes bacterium]NIN22599.1 SUMF1/EgtB/PvdO family nonheme iron enzyme [Candidatus Aminicenantes bacterium]NIN46361.1 SUMF1/EgtB/PvdO family nonheme iron enzyme [Candidatus Aminicenantes bacterium]NIN89209.1 SUMF1/EgtB/PvdO family nonheme iron enzyme [Candidatus Aminicenantes bacterium]